jgi:hypothetical protein
MGFLFAPLTGCPTRFYTNNNEIHHPQPVDGIGSLTLVENRA